MEKLSEKGLSAVQALLFVLLFIMTLAVGSYLYTTKDEANDRRITNFEQCAAAGNPIMESFPEQCAANGQVFVNTAQTNQAFPTTDIPENWKQFTDDDYGISFYYPPSWRITEATIDAAKDGTGNVYSDGATKVKRYCIRKPSQNQWCPHLVQAYDVSVDESIRQYSNYVRKQAKAEPTVSDVSIGALRGKSVSYDNDGERVTAYFAQVRKHTFALPDVGRAYADGEDYLSQDEIMILINSISIEE